jgi:Bacteriophage Sf6, terminase small subunit-like
MTDDQPKRGRPSDYSAQVAMSICHRLVDGESLRAICGDARMPGRATVFRWIARHKEFRDRYTLARKFIRSTTPAGRETTIAPYAK